MQKANQILCSNNRWERGGLCLKCYEQQFALLHVYLGMQQSQFQFKEIILGKDLTDKSIWAIKAMSDIFIAFLVFRYIITCIEKDIIPIIHSSTEKLFVCKQASNFCLNTLEFISSVQLVGEVGENEGTHHLIEARAQLPKANEKRRGSTPTTS